MEQKIIVHSELMTNYKVKNKVWTITHMITCKYLKQQKIRKYFEILLKWEQSFETLQNWEKFFEKQQGDPTKNSVKKVD